MAPFSIGDVVWVRVGNGDHEEPATVVELGCATDAGEEGVACKLHVSFFESIFALNQVRVMPTGRPTRRGSSSAPARRKLVTPSPTQVNAGKRKEIVSSEKSNVNQKKRKVSAPTSPHFEKSKKPVKTLRNTLKEGSDNKSRRLVVNEATDSSEDESSIKLKKPAAKARKATVTKRDKVSKAGVDSKGKAPLKKLFDDENDESSDPSFSDDSADSDEDAHVSSDKIIEVSKKAVAKTKTPPVAKRKQQVKPSGKRVEGSDDESDGDFALAALKKSARKGKVDDIKSKSVVKPKPAVEGVPSAADEESDSDTDHPYKVEYSPTGRATCRRCDETIPKGAVRISHIPLFRGKVRFPTYGTSDVRFNT